MSQPVANSALPPGPEGVLPPPASRRSLRLTREEAWVLAGITVAELACIGALVLGR